MEDVVTDFLKILGKTEHEVQSLPQTSADFETCSLRSTLYGQLDAQLGSAVDEALGLQELRLDPADAVCPDAINKVVARLAASPPFVSVVNKAREAIEQAAEAQLAAAATPVANATDGSVAATGAAGVVLRRNVDALSSSDTEREDMRVKKKAARRDDWVGMFDLSGGLGGGISPRVDIEAALGQLETGLGGSGSSATSSVEALGLLAQAMTLHWVMYEKSMGMCAADMCEGVLAHARGYFSNTIHVLSAASVHRRHMPAGGKGTETADVGTANLMVIGDSKLACAARMARALHGMLVTIHETFQHLPERRVWSIVSSFFSLLGDTVASLEGAPGDPTGSGMIDSDSDVNPDCLEGDGNGNGCGYAAPLPDRVSCQSKGNPTTSTVLVSAHFLAVVGRVDDWLPAWLRSLPTGQLVRAVNDAGLVEAMTRRCKSHGQIPFCSRNICHRPSGSDPAVAAAVVSNGARGTAGPTAPESAPPESCQPKAAVVRHRLSVSAGSSGTFSSAGSAAPLGRALWLSAAELERSLLLQSVSFLGILATHCRGMLRPCPPIPDDEDGSEEPVTRVEREREAIDGGVNRGLEQAEEVLQALVQCAWDIEERRTESATGASLLSRRAHPTTKRARSRSVRFVALDYVERLAKATAGGESTPFSAVAVQHLFSSLDGAKRSGGGQRGSFGERDGSDGCMRETDESPGNDCAAFLGALAEIAGVLLSSRGASAGFFVDGPDGLQASCALLELVRCAAELARRACWHCCPRGEKSENETSAEGHGDKAEGGFMSLEKGDLERLAVRFSCALASIMCNPPKQRAAGLQALWQGGVPQALATLVLHLEHPRPEELASPAQAPQQAREGKQPASRTSDGGNDAVGYQEFEERNTDLHDRLLLSLVQWARDLEGVNYLRRVGLAAPCGSFLARELGWRHLNRLTRDECASPRSLALAMRLALCEEALNALLSADGGVVDGVEGGLTRLGELSTLPELLESQMVDLPPPHTLDARRVGGDDSGAGGLFEEELPRRFPGLKLGSDAGDLRCLDVISRVALSGSFLCSDSASLGARQMERWLHWGLSRAAPCANPRINAGRVATKEGEDGYVPQDVRVAALHVVTNLAADLSTAIAIEAEWSLADTLVQQMSDEEMVDACTSDDAGVGGEGVGRTASKSRESSGTPCNSDGGSSGGKHGVGSVCVPNIVEPAALSRARLAVSLTCLGGPNEERHVLLRRLRHLEASAGGVTVNSGKRNASATSARTASGVRGMSEIEFPGEDASDEDWWSAVDQCVPTVVACLTDPDVARRKEAFALLSSAAARRSLLLPKETTRRLAEPRAADCASPCDDGERGGPEPQGSMFDRRQEVMVKLCFSYARDLGFVDNGCREVFASGLRATLAGVAEPTAGLTSRSSEVDTPATPWQADWFAAVAFMASGMDSAAASEMLQVLHRQIFRAAFLLPLAGKRYASKAARDTAGCTAAARDPPAHVAQEMNSGGHTHEVADVYSRVCASPLSGDGAPPAAADPSRGDPPLLLLISLVEELLEEELPLMSAALRGSGWAAAPLAARWVRQCMLSIVDWPGVVAFLALSLLRGHDYQVYFVVALFRAAQPCVMEAASKGLDLTGLLGRGEALEAFNLEESLSFMEALERRHRGRCIAATKAYLAQC
ncbi:unnamed protein product [Ectocarpus sp. CCAP 1310/34]|nr:unnamed protein product [Ectocarpus sp. CCAP 1310/34]